MSFKKPVRVNIEFALHPVKLTFLKKPMMLTETVIRLKWFTDANLSMMSRSYSIS